MFWSASKKQTRSIWNFIEISKNDNYTAGNLIGFLYHQNYYKLNDIDLTRKTNATIPQKINFVGKLEVDYGVTMLFIAEKYHNTIVILNFFWFINCHRKI